MSVANPQNEWEQGMLDAYHTLVIDPIVEQVARELGYPSSQSEQKKRHGTNRKPERIEQSE